MTGQEFPSVHAGMKTVATVKPYGMYDGQYRLVAE